MCECESVCECVIAKAHYSFRTSFKYAVFFLVSVCVCERECVCVCVCVSLCV